ncbi:hypothetical protein [uncultured Metabacillus sp.]|uniref:hypothetical protein n=1 Tax=uncultured Metabacillus sp. TaxID=2860135 RepID=UPI0026196B59|nr:hypothetical protein [uncultured Metabacillus sp.]
MAGARKYIVNDNFFDAIDTESKAYWLGFIYADGCVTTHKNSNSKILEIGLQLSDKDHLEKFKQDIETSYRITEKKNSCRISIVSEKIFNDLNKYGIVARKSNSIKPPRKDMIPEHLEHHFIRGIFDGDGGFTLGDKYLTFAINFCGTKETCEYILDYFNLNVAINGKKGTNENFRQLRIKGNVQSLQIANKLYEDATVYLDRKYDQYTQLQQLNDVQNLIDEISKLEFDIKKLEMTRLLKSGLTGKEIASIYECGETNLTRYTKEYRNKERLEKEKIVLDLFNNGITNKSEIHRQTGFSRDYIRKVLKQVN